jgi:hypothetical protein
VATVVFTPNLQRHARLRRSASREPRATRTEKTSFGKELKWSTSKI